MGVDANVITFERIKEELRDGCELDEALTNGFKRGLAPIIDGNVTVVIVAAILIGAFGPTDGIFAKILKPIFFAFGPSTAGAIYSFGYTLLIGVVLNFVYGILATRLMLRAVSKMNMFRNPALYGAKKSYKVRKMLNFIANSKKFYIGSVAVIAAIFIYSTVVGVSMDIQFKGGALLTYGYEDEIAVSEIEDDFKAVLGNELSVQQGSNIATGKETITVTLPGEQTVTTDKLAEIETMLGDKYAQNNVEQLEVNNVNPTIGKEFFAKSIVGLVAACVLILIYVAIRFSKIGGFAAGTTAIVALIHDLIIIFGVFAICRFAIDGNFIAALLTILGYSVNDTVVIYDRVRENKALYPSMEHGQLVNLSINQSLVRSINTTVSTIIALGTVCVVAFVAGLDGIVTFAFPLTLGMISGVYSTICIAGPLWVDYRKKFPAKEPEEETEE